MRVSGFIFLTILFLILSSIDMQVNLFLIDFFIVSNFTYLFLCYLCFVNPQKINSLFAAYIGFFIDLHQNVFFGLHATLFTLTVLLINYNYFRLRMFSTFQIQLLLVFLLLFLLDLRAFC